MLQNSWFAESNKMVQANDVRLISVSQWEHYSKESERERESESTTTSKYVRDDNNKQVIKTLGAFLFSI